MTTIEWTDKVWNPVAGCKMVSPGCTNCYAQTMAKRLRAMAEAKGDTASPYLRVVDDRGKWTGKFETVPERLADPLGWRKPARVVVNSMSDLFGEGVPFEFIAAVFGVMAATPRHTYHVLTKRPARMVKFFAWLTEVAADEFCGSRVDLALASAATHVNGDAWDRNLDRAGLAVEGGVWPLPNVWLGVSVENQAAADERIPLLLQAPAAVRFLSCEPLLAPVDLSPDTCDLCGGHEVSPAEDGAPWCIECDHEMGDPGWLDPEGINWVIVGGESGPDARACKVSWVRDLVRQCSKAGVALVGVEPRASEASNLALRAEFTVRPLVVEGLVPQPADPSVAHKAHGGGAVFPLTVRPQPGVVPAAAATFEVPNLSAVGDDAWVRSRRHGDVTAAILAVLKAHGGPMDRQQARLGALLCLEPHLLAPQLEKTEKAHWVRVVGAEAKKAVSTSIDSTTQEWGTALTGLRGRGKLIENLQMNTWSLGAGTDALDTSGWPEGRAGFVVNVLRRLQSSTQADEIIRKLPSVVRKWLDHAA